jgi:hypothetical protein
LVAVSYLHVSLVICRTPRQDDEKGLKYFELPRSLTCVWLHDHRERIDSYAQEHIIARRTDTTREQDEIHIILKVLALGADVALIGRPLARMSIAGGVEAVRMYLEYVKDDIRRAMILTGCDTLSEANGDILVKS